MHQMLKSTSSKSRTINERYRDVAMNIGSGNRRDYIKKNLDALAIYDVIRDADYYGDPNTNELNFSFGVLYTALDYRPIAGFLGTVEYDSEKDEVKRENDPIANPTSLRKKNIQEFYSWCFYKGNNGKTVLGESRNLSKLAAVLRSKDATAYLRKTKDLELAYEKSEGIAEELESSLGRALSELRYANSIIANVPFRLALENLARQVRQQAMQVFQTFSAKQGQAAE
jgi:hypothetical protein